jgi:hypothetical protein
MCGSRAEVRRPGADVWRSGADMRLCGTCPEVRRCGAHMRMCSCRPLVRLQQRLCGKERLQRRLQQWLWQWMPPPLPA